MMFRETTLPKNEIHLDAETQYLVYCSGRKLYIKRGIVLLERKYGIMLVSFLNSFMSYLVVMLVIVVVAGVATAIGITMAKKKAAKEAAVASIKGGNE